MKNSNDFRQYSYSNDTSYIINSFDYRRSSAQTAPKFQPEVEPDAVRDFKIRGNQRLKSNKQITKEERLANNAMVKIIGIAMVFLALFGFVLNSFAVKYELTREIAKVRVDISNSQSENVSLQTRLDGMVSMSMIDEYAVSKLGMTKVKSNNIQYMDVSEYKAKRAERINAQSLPEATKQLTNLSGNKK